MDRVKLELYEDNQFFRKIGFIKISSLDLNCSRADFVSSFQKRVGGLETFKDTYFPKEKFKGSIRNLTFDIQRSHTTRTSPIAGVLGQYFEVDGKTRVVFKTYIPIITVALFSILIFAFCWIQVYLAYTNENNSILLSSIFFIFSIGFAIRAFFLFRKEVSDLEYDLNREFVYWTHKNP